MKKVKYHKNIRAGDKVFVNKDIYRIPNNILNRYIGGHTTPLHTLYASEGEIGTVKCVADFSRSHCFKYAISAQVEMQDKEIKTFRLTSLNKVL